MRDYETERGEVRGEALTVELPAGVLIVLKKKPIVPEGDLLG